MRLHPPHALCCLAEANVCATPAGPRVVSGCVQFLGNGQLLKASAVSLLNPFGAVWKRISLAQKSIKEHNVVGNGWIKVCVCVCGGVDLLVLPSWLWQQCRRITHATCCTVPTAHHHARVPPTLPARMHAGRCVRGEARRRAHLHAHREGDGAARARGGRAAGCADGHRVGLGRWALLRVRASRSVICLCTNLFIPFMGHYWGVVKCNRMAQASAPAAHRRRAGAHVRTAATSGSALGQPSAARAHQLQPRHHPGSVLMRRCSGLGEVLGIVVSYRHRALSLPCLTPCRGLHAFQTLSFVRKQMPPRGAARCCRA